MPTDETKNPNPETAVAAPYVGPSREGDAA
jgi:hypothetical protein